MNLLVISGKKSKLPDVYNYSCYIIDSDGNKLQIFNQLQEYYIVEEWFKANIGFIEEEKEPKFLQNSESLLSAIEKIYADFPDGFDPDIDFEIDSKLNSIHEYRTRHDLGFAFRGTDISDVIVGLYNRYLTISWLDKNKNIQSKKIEKIKMVKDI